MLLTCKCIIRNKDINKKCKLIIFKICLKKMLLFGAQT